MYSTYSLKVILGILWRYQLIYFDVLCLCDNHYVLLTKLSEVLQSRMTGESDVFEKMIQIYNHQQMAKVVKDEENKGNIVSDRSPLTDDVQNTSSSHHPQIDSKRYNGLYSFLNG